MKSRAAFGAVALAALALAFGTLFVAFVIGVGIGGGTMAMALGSATVAFLVNSLVAAAILWRLDLLSAEIAVGLFLSPFFLFGPSDKGPSDSATLLAFFAIELAPTLVGVEFLFRRVWHVLPDLKQTVPAFRRKRFWVVGILAMAAIAIDLQLSGVPTSTRLHDAVAPRNGDIEAVKEAIAEGSDVNVQDRLGQTPLHIAAGAKNMEVVRLLLAAGADPNVRDNRLRTPLHEAAHSRDGPAIIDALIAAGADINIRDSLGQTALHDASGFLGSEGAVASLVAAGADVNAEDNLGETPMHEAASRSNAQVIEILSKAGADLEARNSLRARTPLLIAARYGHLDVIKSLLAEGASVAAVDSDGNTVLHMAAVRGHPDESPKGRAEDVAIVNELLARGADPFLRNADGELPVDIAEEDQNSPHIAEALERAMTASSP